MSGFDIETLRTFSPPKYYCKKCFALYVELPEDRKRDMIVCTTCGVEYVPGTRYLVWSTPRFFDDFRLTIKFEDTLAHCRRLARIAATLRACMEGSAAFDSPMTCLLDALNAAQQFVHFVSYGMSPQLVGALRMASRRVPVRGIVSNAAPTIIEELKDYAYESYGLKTHVYARSDRPADWDHAPHQKIIVIDGLIAFKGSANLTVDGWRKAAKGLDSVEVVTDVREVMTLNNRLFSPVWARESEVTQFIMDDEIPF